MTGFAKAEAKEKGISVGVEIRSVNGRYLEINCKMPKILTHKEFELKELLREKLTRGSISVSFNLETDAAIVQFSLNETAAIDIFKKLKNLNTKLKLNQEVKLDHLISFSSYFLNREDDENSEIIWRVAKKAILEAIKQLEAMRRKEGTQIAKDLRARMASIKTMVTEIESLGLKRIPDEREKIRNRIAQLFDSDEIDEQRLQMEMVLMADKLDISEECVRLDSHIKFFFESLKSKDPSGRKINFLLQEMHREVNTIGNKANDAVISQLVVSLKEEIERIREQVQNIE